MHFSSHYTTLPVTLYIARHKQLVPYILWPTECIVTCYFIGYTVPRRETVQTPLRRGPTPWTAGRHAEEADRTLLLVPVRKTNIGSVLHRIGTMDDDTCWLCETGQRQTLFHLVARCPTLRGQQRVLWRRVERLGDWEEPRAREVKLLFDDVRAAPAVLTFLRDTQVGGVDSPPGPQEKEGGGARLRDRQGGGGDEDGPGPP